MEGGISIEIKVVGSKTHNGIKLIKNIKKINSDINIDVKEINDVNYLKKYNIKNTPALIINNNVVSEGKVLTTREICKLLTSY